MNGELIAVAIAAYVIAGFIKGTIGIGLPTAAITLFAQASGDARLAISLVIVPMIVLNAWQCWRSGDIVATLLRFKLLAVLMSISIFIAAFGASQMPTPMITLILGLAISLFAATSLWRDWPAMPARLDRVAQVFTGLVCGVMGGVSGVWAPPLVIYLTALRVDKDTFVRATGVLLFLGSAILGASYALNDLLTLRNASLGLLLVVPALLGYVLGEKLRTRLSGPVFRKTVLLFFLLMGLNLVRRSVSI